MTPYLDALISLFRLLPTPPLKAAGLAVLIRAIIISHRHLEYLPDARPLIYVTGGPGTGKTSLTRCIGQVVNPSGFALASLPENERDYWILLSNTNPAVLDNVERAPKYVADALAAATSGASRSTRKLYTDSIMVRHRALGFLMLTTFSGGIIRGDLLDRSIIIRLGIPKERLADGYLKSRIEFRRPQIESEFRAVAEAISARIAERGYPAVPPTGSGRNADFAILGHLISEIVGGERDAQLFDDAMVAMAAERIALACDSEALLAAVVEWSISASNNDGFGRPIWITASGLVTFIAGVMGGSDAFEGTTRDANKLGRFLSELGRMAAGLLRVETRTVRGVREYRITPLFDRALMASTTAENVD